MKKNLFNSIKIIAIAAVLAVGVSYVSAFSLPANGPDPVDNPINNVPAPINIGSLVQTKIGSLTTESFFKAGNNITPGTTGWVIAANAAGATDNGGITSLWQFFQKEYLPGTKSQMKVGSPNPGRTTSPLPSVDKAAFNPKDASIPLTIDLIDRGTGNNSVDGTQVMDLLAGDVCNNATTVQTNTAGVQFWSTLNNSNADVIARGIQIGDSSAGAMKVLVATDTAGNAVWGTMRIANGQVVVDYPGSSDVAAGQVCGVAPVNPTYSWYTGDWSCGLSITPGGWQDANFPDGSFGQSCQSWVDQNSNTKSRSVWCTNNTTFGIVDDSLCIQNVGPKPSTTSTTQGSCPPQGIRALFNSSTTIDRVFDNECAYVKPTGGTLFTGCVHGQNAPDGTYKPTSHCKVESTGTFTPCYGPPGAGGPGSCSSSPYGDFIDVKTQIYK